MKRLMICWFFLVVTLFDCGAGLLSGWRGVEAMFGEKLDYYDKSLWNEDPLPTGLVESPETGWWKDGRPGVRCYDGVHILAKCVRGAHRECIVEFQPHKKSELFDVYKAHLLPVSHKTFHITAQKSFGRYGNGNECADHFSKVKDMLILKYGQPVVDNGASVTFKEGKKEIGLICTNLTGEYVVYIDVFIREMVEKDLIEEYKRCQASKLEAL